MVIQIREQQALVGMTNRQFQFSESSFGNSRLRVVWFCPLSRKGSMPIRAQVLGF